MVLFFKKSNPKSIPIVSFDIVNHGIASLDQQLIRINSLNEIIRKLISHYGEQQIVWASGGDGGHVALLLKNWHTVIIKLLIDLRRWAIKEEAEIRISCHFGSVVCIIGADGRPQLVGKGINFCGSLINFGHSCGVVVSTAFMKAFKQIEPELVDFIDPRTVNLKHSIVEKIYILSLLKYPELHGKWDDNHFSKDTLLGNSYRIQTHI